MRTLRSLIFFQRQANVQCKEKRQNTMNLEKQQISSNQDSEGRLGPKRAQQCHC